MGIRGAIDEDQALYLIVWITEQMAASRMDDDPVLDDINRQLWEVERAHGLEEDEFWLAYEAPAEHRELSAQWDRRFDQLWVTLLREVGEPEIARMMQINKAEFDERFERGREFFHGPLPRELRSGADETTRGD